MQLEHELELIATIERITQADTDRDLEGVDRTDPIAVSDALGHGERFRDAGVVYARFVAGAWHAV
ncbi:hypothetical protein SD37_11645 [Amycolatopsis orientalis]|uniref:Uncharacterized protein n=1 Tax=Amycolatopsis orientalis TaxID=31958 RepID=A0A193BVH4_AMYOR|nr:hypothetical protein [Amycolatopsis orientalis]ANN16231.1 hypothetical protein SD37_11645 [Amycolatopsis orientalis]